MLPSPDALGGMIRPPCGQVTSPLSFKPREADVLIVFDRSGSMQTAFGPGTRYSVEAAILKDLIATYDQRISFGFQQFPSKSDCGGAPGCCPEATHVAVGLGKAEAILAAIDDAAPVSGSTPTAAALNVARVYFAAQPTRGADRYVLLSTDGHPSCTRDGWLADDVVVGAVHESGPCADAVAAVRALVADGVKVIALGVGGGLGLPVGAAPSCLEQIARAGAAARGGGGPSFFAAEGPQELERALQLIFGAVTRPSCLIKLTDAPPDQNQVAVYFDGVQVPRDATATEGWTWDASDPISTIHVFGEACRRLDRFQVQEIQVRHGCPPCTDAKTCE